MRILAAALCVFALGCFSNGKGEFEIEPRRGVFEASRDYLEWCLEHDSLRRVRAWERDVLARDDMAWDVDKLESLRRSHINFSKEASLGGGSAGGGGCGCN